MISMAFKIIKIKNGYLVSDDREEKMYFKTLSDAFNEMSHAASAFFCEDRDPEEKKKED